MSYIEEQHHYVRELEREVARLNGLLKEFVWAEGDEGHSIVEGMENKIHRLTAALREIRRFYSEGFGDGHGSYAIGIVDRVLKEEK